MSYLESDRLAAIEFLEQHSTELVDWTGRDSHITLAEFIHQRRGEQHDRLERKLDWLHGELLAQKHYHLIMAGCSERAIESAQSICDMARPWPGDLP